MRMFNWLYNVAAFAEEAVTEGAAAAEGAAEPNAAASLIQMLLPMALIVVVFYFLMIRPQRKKDKKVKDMLANLKVGDRICTIGGIFGTIKGIREDSVILAVGDQDMPMVVARWGIRNVEAVSVENDAEVLA